MKTDGQRLAEAVLLEANVWVVQYGPDKKRDRMLVDIDKDKHRLVHSTVYDKATDERIGEVVRLADPDEIESGQVRGQKPKLIGSESQREDFPVRVSYTLYNGHRYQVDVPWSYAWMYDSIYPFTLVETMPGMNDDQWGWIQEVIQGWLVEGDFEHSFERDEQEEWTEPDDVAQWGFKADPEQAAACERYAEETGVTYENEKLTNHPDLAKLVKQLKQAHEVSHSWKKAK